MVDFNGNGNGKSQTKVVLTILILISMALLTWNFTSVQSMQVDVERNKEKTRGLQAEVEAVRTELYKFEDDTRKSNTLLFDKMTDIRVQLGAPKDGKTH